MPVDFNKFSTWIKQHFTDVIIKGKEIRINSIFDTSDTNHHLWLSPDGGKKKRKYGVYHCFKTDQKGSLLKFVQIVEGCDFDTAKARLQGQSSIRECEIELQKMLAEDDYIITPKKKITMELPPSSYLISSLPTNNWWRKKCEEYFATRKIPIDGYYICTDGDFKARIIIPYYNASGELIYWNGRHLGKSRLRYRGPDRETSGVGKGDVIYFPGKWPPVDKKLYICEGEFNAKSLEIAELNSAAAGGKNMTQEQVEILKDYTDICLCLDRDKAGRSGTKNMSALLNARSTPSLNCVVPPKGFNDWNELLVKHGKEVLNVYIQKNEKKINFGLLGNAVDLDFMLEDLK